MSEMEVKRVLEDWRWTLHGIPGVTAVGRASGSVGKIVIYVEKLTREVLETIPPEIEGVPVEIRESGPITILQPPALPMSVEPMARTTRVRPLIGGISVGSVHITAGTLGGVAVDMATRTLVGLSNNHVLLACYDEETEVLTLDGWKRWSEVTETDYLATRGKDGRLEFQKPTRLYKFYYEGEMYRFLGKHIDLLVTPNHRVYASLRSPPSRSQFLERKLQVRRELVARGLVYSDIPNETLRELEEKTGVSVYAIKGIQGWLRSPLGKIWRESEWLQRMSYHDYTLVPAEEVAKLYFSNLFPRGYGKISMTCKTKWEGEEVSHFALPKVRYIKGKDFNLETGIPMQLWCRFMGWWLSEGTVAKNKNQYMVAIRNSNLTYAREIQSLLRQMGFNPHLCKSGRGYYVTVNSKQLYMYLCQFGKSGDRYIPTEIKMLPPALLWEFVSSFIKGDGWLANGNPTLLTKSKRLADDFQEIFLKLGMNASIRVVKGRGYNPSGTYYIVHAFPQTELNINRVEKVPYRGYVYCATVPNGVLLVRRNYKVVWSGNSRWGDQRGYPNGEVVQPGVWDGGRLPDDLVGYAHRGYPVLVDRDNPIDAAIFRPIVDVTPEVLGIEVRKVTAEPEVGMRVIKSGRTSGVTYGEVTCIDATVDIRGWGTARFVDQVLVEPAFMKPGDSGSLVFNAEDGSIVGLGFAGSDRVSVFNRATAVESLLDILILGAPAVGFRLPPGVGSLLVGLGLMALTI